MFDLTSFLTGLVGALIGALATLTVLLLNHRANRRQRIEAEIINLSNVLDKTSAVLIKYGFPPSNNVEIHVKVREALSQATLACVRIMLHLKKKDRIISRWLLARLNLMIADEPKNSFMSGSEILTDLIAWHQGDRDTAWYAEEQRRISVQAESLMERVNLSSAAIVESI